MDDAEGSRPSASLPQRVDARQGIRAGRVRAQRVEALGPRATSMERISDRSQRFPFAVWITSPTTQIINLNCPIVSEPANLKNHKSDSHKSMKVTIFRNAHMHLRPDSHQDGGQRSVDAPDRKGMHFPCISIC
jgi:hypothetical protein